MSFAMPIRSFGRSIRVLVATAVALTVAACAGDFDRGRPGGTATAPVEAPPPTQEGFAVGVVLPLGAPGNAGAVATSLRNAAELAAEEYKGPKIRLIVKDDAGTPEGARNAATAAIAEGAEVVLGPLLATSVQAAAPVVRGSNRVMFAFSTDSTVAGRGVYLLSFMPENDIDRVVEFAAQKGRKSFAALVPEGAYGNVAAASFQAAVARRGLPLATIERYAPGQSEEAARRIATMQPPADALFVPESGDGAAEVGQAMTLAGIDTKRIQLLGAGVWDDPRVLRVPQFQGGWFAAPDKTGFTAFAQRYRARFGTEPSRIASLAYDAVFLVAALHAQFGPNAFAEATVQNPDGMIGIDGLFRFRQDGTSRRALAVLQVANGTTQVVGAAPRSFSTAGQ